MTQSVDPQVILPNTASNTHTQATPGSSPATPQGPAKSSYRSRASYAIPGLPVPGEPIKPAAPMVPAQNPPSPLQAAAESVSAAIPEEQAHTSEETAASEVADMPLPPKVEDKTADKDFSKRLAMLSKRESKFAEEKRAFAQERDQFKTQLERIKTFENVLQIAKDNPLGLLTELGIDRNKLLNQMVQRSNQKPEELLAEQNKALNARLEAIEKERTKDLEAQKEKDSQIRITQYINGTLTPLLQSEDFKFIRHEYGKEAPQQLWQAIVSQAKQTGSYPTHEGVIALAKRAEQQLKQKAQALAPLLGVSSFSTNSDPHKASAQPQIETKLPGSSKKTSDPTYFIQPRPSSYSVKKKVEK